MKKIESVQYNACLALTGAIRSTSKENSKTGIDVGAETFAFL